MCGVVIVVLCWFVLSVVFFFYFIFRFRIRALLCMDRWFLLVHFQCFGFVICCVMCVCSVRWRWVGRRDRDEGPAEGETAGAGAGAAAGGKRGQLMGQVGQQRCVKPLK